MVPRKQSQWSGNNENWDYMSRFSHNLNYHDDSITRKSFQYYRSFVRKITEGHWWILITKASNVELFHFLSDEPQQALEQSSHTASDEMPWRSCVMSILWFRQVFLQHTPLQSIAVIIWSNTVRYFTNNYRNWGRISIRCWMHKRHTILHPNRWAMRGLLWIFVRIFTAS